MNIKDLEWKLGLFADAAVFDADSKEALRHARDIVAALRAARDLPNTFNAKDLIAEVWATQESSNPGRTDEEIVDQTNRLAREMLRLTGVGYEVPEGYQFHLEKDRHPRARNAWDMARIAQEMLTSTDPQDALDNLAD